MGTPAAAACSLQRLLDDGYDIAGVYTQPDRPSGRGNKIVHSPVKEMALRHGLALFQPTKIRTPEAAAEFTALGAEAAAVVAYGRILPQSFLSAFPSGAVNLHFSLLPKYRGAAPVNWAIVNGDNKTGVTTIKMDAGLDTGDILAARETYIGDDETAPELMERLAVLGADVLSETLAGLDQIEPVPQDNENATFAPIMKREDGAIDWQMKARNIANRVRGFQLFPGSFTTLRGKKAVVWSAKEQANIETDASPGTVIESVGDHLAIAAGQRTVLDIIEIQIEGKRRMSVRELLNGVRIEPGEQFGL